MDRKPKVGSTFHNDTGSNAAFSVKRTEKAQSRGQTEVVVSCSMAPLTSSLMLSKRFHRLCSVHSWFYRASKNPSVKADLASFSHVFGMFG